MPLNTILVYYVPLRWAAKFVEEPFGKSSSIQVLYVCHVSVIHVKFCLLCVCVCVCVSVFGELQCVCAFVFGELQWRFDKGPAIAQLQHNTKLCVCVFDIERTRAQMLRKPNNQTI